MLRSSLPEINQLLYFDQSKVLTELICPPPLTASMTLSNLKLLASQILIVLSRLAVAVNFPSGEKTISLIVNQCPGSEKTPS